MGNRVHDISTVAFMDYFIGGLKPDIRRDIIAQAPSTLIRFVSLAKLPSWSTHLLHLETVLQFLHDHKLLAKFSKCSFGLQQVDYLGHALSGLGVASVLTLPNFSKPFVLETDASGIGVEVVLYQDHHPIAFFSKMLTTRMQNQTTYTGEFYVITKAIAKFRHYLMGHKFVNRTDQKILRILTDQTLQTPEQ
ncbi:PREDICTED: uncharacterized protein LOC109333976 [Lupinus angustifolius]|uniref:uncharacterized protein LOC109333976 n=1 Tax=Lupinus angustifolius TaxID=3871 RepID=UPI00092E3208|nr:PREDICTED: uncharacterized protein LOC109333976 [Lupinus angustifolius]